MSETQKTAVIFGLANKRSIAWAIAQKLQQAGWRLAITYQNERLELEAKDLIAELAGRRRIHVRRYAGRTDRQACLIRSRKNMVCCTDWCTASASRRRAT